MLPTRAGGPGNRRTWALSFLRSSSLRFQRFPRGLSGSRQIARERCCCTPNMPYGAPGNCRQRFLDRAGKPLDERFNEGRGLTERGGPNYADLRIVGATSAFTLPDGTIIVLDELITSIGDDAECAGRCSSGLGR